MLRREASGRRRSEDQGSEEQGGTSGIGFSNGLGRDRKCLGKPKRVMREQHPELFAERDFEGEV